MARKSPRSKSRQLAADESLSIDDDPFESPGARQLEDLKCDILRLGGPNLVSIENDVEREYWIDLVKEYRVLREIASKVPGPNHHDPREKIWRYLIAEYRFTPETLWRLTPQMMERYIEARLPSAASNQTLVQHTGKEEWKPVSEAVNLAIKHGYKISDSYISKNKDRLCTRGRTISGQHKREVELGSLWRLLHATKGRPQPQGEEQDIDEPTAGARDQIDGRIKRAQARNRESRDLE